MIPEPSTGTELAIFRDWWDTIRFYKTEWNLIRQTVQSVSGWTKFSDLLNASSHDLIFWIRHRDNDDDGDDDDDDNDDGGGGDDDDDGDDGNDEDDDDGGNHGGDHGGDNDDDDGGDDDNHGDDDGNDNGDDELWWLWGLIEVRKIALKKHFGAVCPEIFIL